MQDIGITPDKVLNSLAYGSPFCVIMYTNFEVTKWTYFSWLKLIGIFSAVPFLQTYAKNI